MKLELDITQGRITIEGDGQELITVLEKARELAPHLKEIRLLTGHGNSSDYPSKTAVNESVPSESQARKLNYSGAELMASPRDFAKAVSPSNTPERIATAAYYISRYEGKEVFTPKELSVLFERFGFERPAQMPVALFTARKRYGYVESGGHGLWKLAIGGSNFITRKMKGNGVA